MANDEAPSTSLDDDTTQGQMGDSQGFGERTDSGAEQAPDGQDQASRAAGNMEQTVEHDAESAAEDEASKITKDDFKL